MAQAKQKSAPLPWLSMLLACAFAVATWQSIASVDGLVDGSRSQIDQAIEYLRERPYLEADPVLRARIGPNEVMRLRVEHGRMRDGRGDNRVLGVELRAQQEHLDGLIRQATRQLDTLPARSLGVNPTEWRPGSLFTYLLVHSNWIHLGGGVVVLLLLGMYLEPALGVARLASLIALATLGAAAGHAFVNPELDRVLIGSSGMLAGLLVVFLAEFAPSRKESFYVLGFVVGVLWLVGPPAFDAGLSYEHDGARLTGFPIPAMSIAWVYLGGITTAIAGYGVMRLLGARPDVSRPATHSAKTSTGNAGLDGALALRAAGRDEEALKELLVLSKAEPDSVDVALLLADVAGSLGKEATEETSRLRVVRLESKTGDGSGAVSHWRTLVQREIPQGVEPALLVRMAGLLRQHNFPREAADALRTALDRASGSSAMIVAGRVARAAKDIDPIIAHDAAWKALSCAELPFVERQELEVLLGQVIPKLPGAELSIPIAEDEGLESASARVVDAKLRSLDVVYAVPIDLDNEGLHVATKSGLKKRILFERVEAVSVAGVNGIAERPVLVIDLVLNWNSSPHESLRVLRLRGDLFDPCKLVPGNSSLDSWRRIVMTVLERAEAMPLPDRDSVLGRPFVNYADVATYEKQVLAAEQPLSENPS